MAARTMTIPWPPRALGLGPPLNLVTLSRERRGELRRGVSQSVALGLAAAIVVAAIDQFIFDGETARRTPALDAHPTPLARVLIALVGSLGEELFFRVLVATAVATLVWLALRSVATFRAVAVAQWTGTLAAALYSCMWHVSMLGASGNLYRVIAVNAVGNILYGWMYWRRGFELAVLTHWVVTATLYIGLAVLR